MKKMNRFLVLLLAVCMMAGLLPAHAAGTGISSTHRADTQRRTGAIASPLSELGQAVAVLPSRQAQADAVEVRQIDRPDVDLKQTRSANAALETPAIADDQPVKVMVVLEDRSLLARGFSTAQIAASPAALRAARELNDAQDAVLAEIHSAVDGVTEKYRYNVALSGLSLVVPYGSLETIRGIGGVKSAFLVPCYDLPQDMGAQEARPNMDSASGLSGAVQTWNTLGYDGEGMRVAIIDTGIDTDHPSFLDAPALTGDSLTKEEVSRVLTDLNAYEIYGSETLKAQDLYISEKIPFGFNYVDMSLDVTHDHDMQGDHGSHVAGIAAANDIDSTEVVGMAPEAQLLVMKVFGKNGGAYFDDILAALEDSFRLNADAVNLSLGSPSGFSSESPVIDEIFSQILQSDMIVSISAGNETSFSHGNAYGTEMNFAADPDVGIVGSPGTYLGATTVASMENSQLRLNYFTVDGSKICYNDVGMYPIAMNYGGTTMEYVMVPGTGEAADYAHLDVEGKVAVIQRGGLDFTTKQTNAYDAGAAVCIVYDNVDGERINMMDAELLPNAFISKADGAILAQAAGTGGTGTLVLGDAADMIAVDSPLAGRMSTFSSVGVTPDLKLEPDITTYGGNIYSCYMDGRYGMMSGTSMSAPAVAGMSALLLQYLRQQHEALSDSETHTVAEALLMSTATAVVDPDNASVHYSPRKQGAGNANIYNAIVSPAYLTVDGATPKVSLGDDDSRTGRYTFDFEVNNFSDAPVHYTVSGYAMTDQINLDYADDGYLFMSETGRKLDGSVTFSVSGQALDQVYDLNDDGRVDLEDTQLLLDMVNGVCEIHEGVWDTFDLITDGILDTADAQLLYEMVLEDRTNLEQITVSPGQTLTVTATVTLTAEDKAYMDAYYENGIYVEGFVTLTAADETCVDLSLPYMGFYGDWSDARMFDSGYWYEDDSQIAYMRYPHVVFTQFADSDYGYNLGLNPYLVEQYDPWHNVISANDDGYADYIGEIYLGLMRNAKKLDFTWDIYDENGNFVKSIVETADYARKSCYNPHAGMNLPFMYSDYYENAAEITAGLPDGFRVELSVTGWLDDGDDVADERLTLPVGDRVYDSIPIYIDNTAPEIVNGDIACWYNEAHDQRRIEFDVRDNHAIAAVALLTEAGQVMEMIPVADSEEPTRIQVDVTGYDSNILIAVCDYGANETYYAVTFSGKYNADFDRFYGYRVWAEISNGDHTYTTDTRNGWHSFESADSMLQHTDQYASGETPVAAAEYVDGYILGVDVEGRIFAMRSGQWTRAILGTLEVWGDVCTASDMAFDHVSNTMYLLTQDGGLVRMDYLTGQYQYLGYIYDSNWDDDHDFSRGLTLACDNEGVLYTVDAYSGDLFTIDPVEVTATYVGSTGYWPWDVQAMTVDHETNELYWAANEGGYGNNDFFRVDKATGALTFVADMEYNSAVTGLFKPWASQEPLFPKGSQVTALQLSQEKLMMAENSVAELLCKQLPYYADALDVTWTSSDESVVQVHEGHVLAVSEGRAVVTVTAGDLSAQCAVEVFAFHDTLYAYDMGTTGLWVRFPAADPSHMTLYQDAAPSGSGFTSAAYHDGWVYASEYDGGFYRLDPQTLQGSKLGSSGSALMGMAYNYTDGYMYAVKMTTGQWGDQSFDLVRVNLLTGETRVVQALDNETYGTVLCSLAIDYEGSFYMLTTDYYSNAPQIIRCVLTDYGLEIAQTANLSRYPTYGFGAMHYSPTSGGIYWTTDTGNLLWASTADLSDLQVVDLGLIGYASSWPQVLGVYTIPEQEPESPVVEPEEILLPETCMVLQGGSTGVGLRVEPWNATAQAVYAIADPSVASVDAAGVITGVAPGETTLTVTMEAIGYKGTVKIQVLAATGHVYGYMIRDFVYNGDVWIHMPDTDPTEVVAEGYGDEAFSIHAGAYYNGAIYGVAQDQLGTLDYRNFFVKVSTADHTMTRLAEVSANVRDMAFDYTTGTLYGIAQGGTMTGAIVQFDAGTGEMVQVAETDKTFAAMTIDTSGQMYGICQTDDCLYAIDKHTGAVSPIGATGADAGAVHQSMTFDPETGSIYWAQAADNNTSSLRLVSTLTGLSASLGPVGPYGAQMSCLYTETEREPTVPAVVTPKGIQLTEKAFVVTHTTVQLQAAVLPLSVSLVDRSIVWTSSDTSVATVSNGTVTGVSAGTAVITATNASGDSAVCTVTVSDTHRSFFAYDRTNRRWIRFAGDDTANVTAMRSDAAGETPLLAAAWTGETLYAYDEAGLFYTLDADTFQRTPAGSGVSGQTLSIPSGDLYTMECTMVPTDLSYDETSGILYAAMELLDEDGWNAGSILARVNTEDGTVESLFHSQEVRPGNLLVVNGKAFFVDTRAAGMLTVVDLATGVCTQQSQIQDYWGEAKTSSSFIRDSYTGTVYVIRDMTDTWEGDWETDRNGQAILYTLDLSSGGLVSTTAGEDLIAGGIMACGLFLK